MRETDCNPEAIINPEVLKWAREQASLQTRQAAEIAGMATGDYEAVEAGEKRMTLRQLRAVAEKIERPIAFFYLPAPPDVRAESDDKRYVRIRQEAVIEINAEFSDEDIKRALVFAFFDERTGELYKDDETGGFRVADYLATVIEPEPAPGGSI